jgi:hypothetical protein
MSSTLLIIFIVIAVLVLGLIAFLINPRRQHYVWALRGRGWTFESRPSVQRPDCAADRHPGSLVGRDLAAHFRRSRCHVVSERLFGSTCSLGE